MNNYDDLYKVFRQADEERKRTNFNAFMNCLTAGMIKDLNRYYVEDRNQYEITLNNLKKQGIRVFRDSNGRHKLQFI